MDSFVGLGDARFVINIRGIMIPVPGIQFTAQVNLLDESGTGMEQAANGGIGGMVFSMIGGPVIEVMVRMVHVFRDIDTVRARTRNNPYSEVVITAKIEHIARRYE